MISAPLLHIIPFAIGRCGDAAMQCRGMSGRQSPTSRHCWTLKLAQHCMFLCRIGSIEWIYLTHYKRHRANKIGFLGCGGTGPLPLSRRTGPNQTRKTCIASCLPASCCVFRYRYRTRTRTRTEKGNGSPPHTRHKTQDTP